MWSFYTVTIVQEFAGVDSAWLCYKSGRLQRWSSEQVWLQCFKLIENNFICQMEKLVQIFNCIISHSSTKSLVPPWHKFAIWNLDLFFPFFGKKCCVLTDLSIFGEDGKKIVPLESRIAFCQLFIVRVKEDSPRGTSGMFFALCTGVSPPTCSYYKL